MKPVPNSKEDPNKLVLSSSLLGQKVLYNDEYYIDKKFQKITITGTVNALLIDVNFGAYGYLVILDNERNEKINFIDRSIPETKNLIGRDINLISIQ